MFINFSNHPSDRWAKEQMQAAMEFGEVLDVPFPVVSPAADIEEVVDLAKEYTEKILSFHPDCVMCQGEFTLALAVIRRLQANGIRCVCACSERKVMEEQMKDGTTQKISRFEFQQFREYENYRYGK